MLLRIPRSRGRALLAGLGIITLLTACNGQGGSLGPVAPGTSSEQSVARAGYTSMQTGQPGGQRHSASWNADARNRSDKLLPVAANGQRAIRMGGSSSTEPVTAVPPVSVPNEKPCIVTLFSNYSFENYNNNTFSYTPPTGACAGPWNEVVLDVNLSVSAGIQYDRTGSIWIDGTNVWFGTTAEPAPSLSPQWQVQRNVTDLAPIFETASTGNVFIGNNMCCGLTGIIYGTAQLEFYPATAKYPAPATPDVVYSLANPPPGNNTYIGPYESPSLSGTFSFPQNVEQAYLDVYLQGQSSFDSYPLQGFEEFWYSCLPNTIAQTLVNTYGLDQCEGSGFREGEVAIDGQPAGIVPIYPYIFTGGWDPYLWIPIPGLETLSFNPYRVNLTPFAGLLDNGAQHTVAITVFNDQDYFSSNAELLLYEDHGQSVDTGSVTLNTTAAAPSEYTNNAAVFGSSALVGPVSVNGSHTVSIAGVLNTSQGQIITQVQQRATFVNTQQLNVAYNGLTWDQNIQQRTEVDSQTTTSLHGRYTTTTDALVYPFSIDYDFAPTASGYQQKTTVQQVKTENTLTYGAGGSSWANTSNTVNSRDTLLYNSSFSFLGNENAASSQHYLSSDNTGACYNKQITSANNVLTGTSSGC
jgi:hypothetical protein